MRVGSDGTCSHRADSSKRCTSSTLVTTQMMCCTPRMNDKRMRSFVPLEGQVKVLHLKRHGRAGRFSGA